MDAPTPLREHLSIADLVERARRLASGGRGLLCLTGPPAAGRSTVAQRVVDALREQAALVPMDGFHLDDGVLDALGRRGRKGAPDTFDVDGYAHLLRRLRAREEPVVHAPVSRREQEQAVAGALPVPRETPLVVTEGNDLLLDGAQARAWVEVTDEPDARLIDVTRTRADLVVRLAEEYA